MFVCIGSFLMLGQFSGSKCCQLFYNHTHKDCGTSEFVFLVSKSWFTFVSVLLHARYLLCDYLAWIENSWRLNKQIHIMLLNSLFKLLPKMYWFNLLINLRFKIVVFVYVFQNNSNYVTVMIIYFVGCIPKLELI